MATSLEHANGIVKASVPITFAVARDTIPLVTLQFGYAMLWSIHAAAADDDEDDNDNLSRNGSVSLQMNIEPRSAQYNITN